MQGSSFGQQSSCKSPRHYESTLPPLIIQNSGPDPPPQYRHRTQHVRGGHSQCYWSSVVGSQAVDIMNAYLDRTEKDGRKDSLGRKQVKSKQQILEKIWRWRLRTGLFFSQSLYRHWDELAAGKPCKTSTRKP